MNAKGTIWEFLGVWSVITVLGTLLCYPRVWIAMRRRTRVNDLSLKHLAAKPLQLYTCPLIRSRRNQFQHTTASHRTCQRGQTQHAVFVRDQPKRACVLEPSIGVSNK